MEVMDLIWPYSEPQTFDAFGFGHWFAIILLFILIGVVVASGKWLRAHRVAERRIRAGLIIALFLGQAYYYWWNIVFAPTALAQNIIPVHICSAILIPLAWYAFRPNRYLYEIYFFWALLGGGSAMLFPFTEGYNWPHTRVFQTIFVHGLFVLLAIYFTVVDRYELTLFSVLRVWLWTAALSVAAFVVNSGVGSNYMFLGTPPPGTSTPLDLFPSGPFKIPLEAVALLAAYGLIFGIFKLATFRRQHPEIPGP
jgi:hypothetical integral membrane protein (TIGR02206 family)